jgi:hypothetical protein
MSPRHAKLAATMATPQDPGKRRKQKIRRTKRLAEWRLGQVASAAADPAATKAKPSSS